MLQCNQVWRGLHTSGMWKRKVDTLYKQHQLCINWYSIALTHLLNKPRNCAADYCMLLSYRLVMLLDWGIDVESRSIQTHQTYRWAEMRMVSNDHDISFVFCWRRPSMSRWNGWNHGAVVVRTKECQELTTTKCARGQFAFWAGSLLYRCSDSIWNGLLMAPNCRLFNYYGHVSSIFR